MVRPNEAVGRIIGGQMGLLSWLSHRVHRRVTPRYYDIKLEKRREHSSRRVPARIAAAAFGAFLYLWLIASLIYWRSFFVGLFLFVVVAIPLFLSFLSREAKEFAEESFDRAKQSEKDGNHKRACDQYAIAILNGTNRESECRRRITELWRLYGPFDFSEEMEQYEKNGDECGVAGLAVTLSIIKECAGEQARPRAGL